MARPHHRVEVEGGRRLRQHLPTPSILITGNSTLRSIYRWEDISSARELALLGAIVSTPDEATTCMMTTPCLLCPMMMSMAAGREPDAPASTWDTGDRAR